MSLLSETLRYMGVKGEPDAALTALAKKALDDVERESDRRHVWREMPLAVCGNRVVIGDFRVESVSLAAHLSGCDGALLFAATLGSGVDRLLARSGRVRPSLQLAQQAAGAALIEDYADRCCAERQRMTEGRYMSPRFGPGYGDLPLSAQGELLTLLDAARRAGISLTSGGMLIPTKSVTAIVGLSERTVPCRQGGCAACAHTGCAYRREE